MQQHCTVTYALELFDAWHVFDIFIRIGPDAKDVIVCVLE